MANGQGADIAQVLHEWKGLTDWMMSEHRDFREQMERAERLRGEARSRFMVLGAGIVGIVIPLLAKGPMIASSISLARAAVAFIAAVAFSAVADIILRFMGKSMRDAFSKNVEVDFRSKVETVMRMVDPSRKGDPELKELVEVSHRRFAKVQRAREAFRTFDDLVFYGLFVFALWKLARAFI